MTRDPTARSSWQLLASLQQHQPLLPAGKPLTSANRHEDSAMAGWGRNQSPQHPTHCCPQRGDRTMWCCPGQCSCLRKASALTVGLEHAAAHGRGAAAGLPEEMVVGVVRGRAGGLYP